MSGASSVILPSASVILRIARGSAAHLDSTREEIKKRSAPDVDAGFVWPARAAEVASGDSRQGDHEALGGTLT